MDQITPLIDQDTVLDVIGGAAGAIGSLAALHHIAPSARIVATIRRCGERLVGSAEPMPTGIGWPIQGGPALLGFSHGVAGMAWALLEAASLTGEPRFRMVALDGLAYERSRFAPVQGNWPDLREVDAMTAPRSTTTARHGEGRTGGDASAPPPTAAPPSFMHAWCHGAPGIGLGRLCLLRHLDDPATRAEIETALQSTLAAGSVPTTRSVTAILATSISCLKPPGRSIRHDGAPRPTGSPRRFSRTWATMDRAVATLWGLNRPAS